MHSSNAHLTFNMLTDTGATYSIVQPPAASSEFDVSWTRKMPAQPAIFVNMQNHVGVQPLLKLLQISEISMMHASQ
jgi:hypothetical protein